MFDWREAWLFVKMLTIIVLCSVMFGAILVAVARGLAEIGHVFGTAWTLVGLFAVVAVVGGIFSGFKGMRNG